MQLSNKEFVDVSFENVDDDWTSDVYWVLGFETRLTKGDAILRANLQKSFILALKYHYYLLRRWLVVD